jgi:hypothetical protein
MILTPLCYERTNMLPLNMTSPMMTWEDTMWERVRPKSRDEVNDTN